LDYEPNVSAPVIFLAFANEPHRFGGYLRHLAEEASQAPQLKRKLLHAALQTVLTIENEGKQARIIRVLAFQLEGQSKAQGVQVARQIALSIEDRWDQFDILYSILPHLEGQGLATSWIIFSGATLSGRPRI
jgi:hypothetical protein